MDRCLVTSEVATGLPIYPQILNACRTMAHVKLSDGCNRRDPIERSVHAGCPCDVTIRESRSFRNLFQASCSTVQAFSVVPTTVIGEPLEGREGRCGWSGSPLLRRTAPFRPLLFSLKLKVLGGNNRVPFLSRLITMPAS